MPMYIIDYEIDKKKIIWLLVAGKCIIGELSHGKEEY